MGVLGICLLCASHSGFSVDMILGPFPNSLKSKMGEPYVLSPDSKCWLDFILNKLLRIPEMRCGELVCGLSEQSNIRICASCAQLVNADAFYRQQILKFESELDLIGRRVQETMAAKSPDGSSKMGEHNGESYYDVEDVITKVLKAFDTSLPGAAMDESVYDRSLPSGEADDSAAENNSHEDILTRPASKEVSDAATKEGDCRFTNAPSTSTSQANVNEKDIGGYRSDDDTCNERIPGKRKSSTKIRRDKIHCSFKNSHGERTSGDYSSQSHQFSSEHQQDITEIQVSIQRNESADALQSGSAPAQTNKSINTSNINKNVSNGEKLLLQNGTLKLSVYRCTLCSKTFPYSSHLIKHVRSHTGVKPFKCQLCNKAFAVSSNLSAHMRSHTNERPFKCDICQKAFTHSCILKNHIICVHNKTRHFKCQICSKTFPTSRNLYMHKGRHEKAHKCIMCESSFSGFEGLQRHLMDHTNEKPFFCLYCGKEYRRERNLKYHIAACHGELTN